MIKPRQNAMYINVKQLLSLVCLVVGVICAYIFTYVHICTFAFVFFRRQIFDELQL